MTFFHFFAAVLFLFVADEKNPSQLHFGKKCFNNDQGSIYSYVWVTRPNQELPASKEQCEPSTTDLIVDSSSVEEPFYTRGR
jgi:hypothetical protein